MIITISESVLRGGGRFNVAVDCYNVWYSRINDNDFKSEGGVAGVCIRGSFSVNINVQGNVGEYIALFVEWSILLSGGATGNACEGWIIEGNAVAGIKRFFAGDIGLLVMIHNNIIDIIGQTAIHSYVPVTMIQGKWIAMEAGNDFPVISLRRNNHKIMGNHIQANMNSSSVILLASNIFRTHISDNYIDSGGYALNVEGEGCSYITVVNNVLQAQSTAPVKMDLFIQSVYRDNLELDTAAPAIMHPSTDRSYKQ